MFFVLAVIVPAAADEDFYRLHVIFTNDIRGAIQPMEAPFINPEFPPRVGGGAAALKYAKDLRAAASARGEGVLVLDAGNIFQGTPLGTHDGGITIVKWMNAVGYDAMTIGNFDFDHGVDNVKRLSQLAQFPILGGNVFEADNGNVPDYFTPYILKEISGFTIAVLGITTSNIPNLTLPENIERLQFEREIPATRRLVEKVRSEGADVVILLGHLGLPYDIELQFAALLDEIANGRDNWDDSPVNAMELAHFVEGVDVILSGHITKGYDKPWEDPVTHTLCFQTYGGGTSIGHVILLIDRQSRKLTGYQIPSERGALLTLMDDDFQPDFVMVDSISKWLTHAERRVAKDYSSAIERLRLQKPETIEVPFKANRQDKWDIPMQGVTDQVEVATWNIEHFPKGGEATIEAVAEVIGDLGIDIVGLQEVGEKGAFAELMGLLPEYDYVISQSSSFYDQAVIVRKDVVTILGSQELFTYNDYWFAGRPPLKVDLFWQSEDRELRLSVINLHMKCCDDGIPRRIAASRMLANYLLEQLDKGDSNIVVIGDWNDEITDPWHEQSFNPFIQDSEHFYFATTRIAGDDYYASYPSWPSFLDHILISQSLFDENQERGTIRTIRLQDYVGGWEAYKELLSDHLPVVWSIYP